jgi:cytochrome c556
MTRFALFAAALLAVVPPIPAAAQGDARELVKMPAPMQAHMLANMRDHLAALREIMGALAEGNAAKAGRIAEKRIGMSSLESHGASHMAPFMPEPMQRLGTELHKAASRLAVAAENAEVERTYDAQRKVFKAMEEIAAACDGCHQSYRIH